MLIFDRPFLTYQNKVATDAHVHPFLGVPTWYENQRRLMTAENLEKFVLSFQDLDQDYFGLPLLAVSHLNDGPINPPE